MPFSRRFSLGRHRSDRGRYSGSLVLLRRTSGPDPGGRAGFHGGSLAGAGLPPPPRLAQEAASLSKRILRIIVIAEALGAALLSIRFWQDKPFHEALGHGTCTSIAAFCNAGFDLEGNFVSLADYAETAWVKTRLGETRLAIEQSIEMGCPSELRADTADGVVVSGDVLIVGESLLTLP